MNERIAILGAPWSGKNTVTKQLQREGYHVVEAGQLIRKAAQNNETIAQQTRLGKQLSPQQSMDIVTPALQTTGRLALNGFPRQRINAEHIDTGIPLDRAVHLVVPQHVIYERHIQGARGKRIDDGEEVLHTRLAAYFSTDTDEVLSYYEQTQRLANIDGTQTPEEVYRQVRHILHL